MEMRKTLAFELEKLMNINKNIILINSDLEKPNGLFELKQKFPERSINVGIAEQNMACIAAGISSYGFIPFIFSFTPFVTRKICDQIAISICYAKQNVKIIGTDPGLSAEYNGGTHMSVEDIGVLRSIPNILIFEPCDNIELQKALPEIINYNGPVYMRMFRKELKNIYNKNYDFDLFKANIIKSGKDITIICSGITVHDALEANDELIKLNIDAEIINIHTIKPIDKNTIIKSAKKTNSVLVIENHNTIGGLKSAVCEVLSENYPVKIKSLGINDVFGQVGKLDYLKNIYNINSKNIIKKILN